MLKTAQILCLVVCCVVALGFSTDSFARPGDCFDECTPTCPCSVVCWAGGIITCGQYTSGFCTSGLQAETEDSQWVPANDWQLSPPAVQSRELPEESETATGEK